MTPQRQRWKQQASYAGTSEQTIYIGGLIEKVTRGGQTGWRHAIRAAEGTVAIYTRESSGASAIHYLLGDHLGSVEAITDGAGAVEVRLSYAPFGQRRNAAGWSGNPSAGDWAGITATTRHGYTGHEHLDNLSLIHMNGRVYDPYIGRFTSADPLIDGAALTAGWNRYSYVRNNPLSFTDPSGFRSVLCSDSTIPCVPTSPAGWAPLGTSNLEIVDVWGKRLRSAVESLKALTLQQWSIGGMDLKLPGEVADSELEEVVVKGEKPQPPCLSIEGASVDFTSQIGAYGSAGIRFKLIGLKIGVEGGLDLFSYNTPLDGDTYWSHGAALTLQIGKVRIGGSWEQRSYNGGLSFQSQPTNFALGDLNGSNEGADFEVSPPQIGAGFKAGVHNVGALLPVADAPICRR